jgi:hypothetical protein
VTLDDESCAGLDLLARSVPQLELLGGGGDVRAVCERLRALLLRREMIVELAGAQRCEPVAALFGAPVLTDPMAAGVTVRLRRAAELTYSVHWPDGRTEAGTDQSAGLKAALLSRDCALDNARARALEALEALQQMRKLRSSAPPSPALIVPPVTPPRGGLRGRLARLLAWLRQLFARPQPALAAPAPPAPPAVDRDVFELEAELAAADARMATRTAERDRCQRELASYSVERCGRILTRLSELTAAAGEAAIDIGAPEIPPGVVLLLRPPAGSDERESPDATLLTSPEPIDSVSDGRPCVRLEEPRARSELLRELERLGRDRPAAIARRVAAALCLCRNRIVDADGRAYGAHNERQRALSACRVGDPEALRQREEAATQLPVARRAAEVVHDATVQLERLLDEVRAAWEERVDSCVGFEQLRAEVAAVENGAAHRLSLVCDELRETLTIQFVRVVLELSRLLSQELLRKRLEVAHGRSPQLEQTFEDIRVALPASLDTTFSALKAPNVGVGELLRGERGLLDPLFRTLAREKRECIARLRARLDEIAASSARDLFAAAVYVSPLVMAAFNGLVTELIVAHEHWIDTRVAEEQLAWEQTRTRLAPALELVASLGLQEAKIARLLEAG